MKRVIGYGICGPGEAGRYMRDTLEEFKRLCDETIILVNHHGDPGITNVLPELQMIKSYGFKWTLDPREWGKMQWKIKKDFVDNHVSRLAKEGDMMVCLDMDERFDKHLTKEWLLAAPFDAYKVFIVDLWNDEQHYKPASCFWNTRVWRWTGNTEWIVKPLHCGLAPRWAVAYNRYMPFILIHRGLMRIEDRARKIARYEQYDPHARYLAKPFYAMLHSNAAEAFDEEAMHATIAKEVDTYKQTKPRNAPMSSQPKGRFAYVINPGGITIDIPEKMLAETLKRKGFTFVGWADEAEKEMEEMFAEDSAPAASGSYQRSAADEKSEVDALNKVDDEQLNQMGEIDTTKHNRVGMKEREGVRKGAKAKK